MQDYADYANQLVEQIDSGELDPEEVDIRPFVENESDVLTPELRDRLENTNKIEEYNRRVRERQEREVREQQADKRESHREALEAISDPTLKETSTVTLNGQELEVKNYLTGRMEKRLARIEQAEARGAEAVDVARESTIDLITWLIESPEEYTNPEMWREFAEWWGTPELQKAAIELAEPYRERKEEIEKANKFRGDRSR